MSELIPVNGNDQAAREAALAALGMGHLMGGGDSLPRMTINRDFETADGTQIPPRTWTLEVPGIGRVFGRPAIIRVFAQGFQYTHYDASAEWEDNEGNTRRGRMVNRSIIVTDRRHEMIDEHGTTRCGKRRLSLNEYNNLPKAEQDAHKARKPVTHTFGLVRFDEAQDEAGEKHVIDWTPFRWDATGTNRDVLYDSLKHITRQRRLPMEVEIAMELKREQQGSTVWYIAQPTVLMNKTHSLTAEDQETAANFLQWINAYNEPIKEAYNDALKGKMLPEEEELASQFADGVIDGDLVEDDDIPF